MRRGQGTALRPGLRRMSRRFGRPLPLAFAVLAALVLLGGFLHEPNNGDSLGYRLPRILHWLAAGRWHWIHGDDPRMNGAAPGWEWMAAPVILFLKSDRPLFLINWVSFALMPGLTFCLLRQFGVAGRAAWHWMWVLSAGYCYVMQAGSVCNDTFAAPYAIAAIAFALRAKHSGNASDLWVSMLAAALLSGSKQTNLPLLLPWFVTAAPAWRLALARPVGTLFAAVVAAGASLLPNVIMNLSHTGDWTGMGAIPFTPDSPGWCLLANVVLTPLQNAAPPVFPWADAWEHAMSRFVATPLGAHFHTFESFGKIARAAHELSAGLGPCVCLLAAGSWLAARRLAGKRPAPNRSFMARAALLAPWLVTPVLLSRTGMWQTGRYFSAYYPLMLPLLLLSPGHALLARRRLWQILCLLTVAGVIPLVILSRQRPLWPAETVLARLDSVFPNSALVRKARATFAFSAGYTRLLAPLTDALPAGEALLGYASGPSSNETGLWRPFGSRRILRVARADTPAAVRARGIRFVVVEPDALDAGGVDQWTQRFGGRVTAQVRYRVEPEAPERVVVLVDLGAPGGAASPSGGGTL